MNEESNVTSEPNVASDSGDYSASGRTFVQEDNRNSGPLGYIPFTVQRQAPKTTGANAPCPCGKKRNDGKPMKYKKCCMSINVLGS